MRRKWSLRVFFGMIFISAVISTVSASNAELLVFSQKDGQEEYLYAAKSDGSDLQIISSGKDLKIFFLGNYLFYFQEHRLYFYDFTAQSSRLIQMFTEDRIFLQKFTEDPASPNQILVITQSDDLTTQNWYILEVDDGSLRKISRPNLAQSQTSSIKHYSPDGVYLAQIRQVGITTRFELEIQTQGRGKLKAKTLWVLPKNMTVLPEAPVWAPNSEMVAFYAKEFQNSPAGFYHLFLYKVSRQELITIQEQVFNKGEFTPLQMGEFTPDWSGDGRYLFVEYQPFGLPTASSFLKYDAVTGQKTYLADGPGAKGYPAWSPSGQAVLFLSKQKGEEAQLFTIDAEGKNLTRISPPEGATLWAGWYKPKQE
ncbi:MAG: hypothetical protein K6U80_02630 [Firmicutes bacterium]|nr:hypothetical protein [Bacillota bacterium]